MHKKKARFNQNLDESTNIFRSFFYFMLGFEIYAWFCFIALPVILFQSMDYRIWKLCLQNPAFWSTVVFPRRIGVVVKYFGPSGGITSVNTICAFNHAWVYEDASLLIVTYYMITLLMGLLNLLFKIGLFSSYGRR